MANTGPEGQTTQDEPAHEEAAAELHGPDGGLLTSAEYSEVTSGRRMSALNIVMIAALCALLGFGMVLQFRRTATGDALATARPDDLVQILDSDRRREEALSGEIKSLQERLAKIRADAGSAEALAEAKRQTTVLGILSGQVAAQGPGVRITLDDPEGKLRPEILVDAITELRNAGAEAFQVGPVRIGIRSAFTGVPGKVELNGVRLTQPYVIMAIGDPPTLSAAMAIPGGVVDTVRRSGATIDIKQLQQVTIDALITPQPTKYARPAS